jgi:hypothetical protein
MPKGDTMTPKGVHTRELPFVVFNSHVNSGDQGISNFILQKETESHRNGDLIMITQLVTTKSVQGQSQCISTALRTEARA